MGVVVLLLFPLPDELNMEIPGKGFGKFGVPMTTIFVFWLFFFYNFRNMHK